MDCARMLSLFLTQFNSPVCFPLLIFWKWKINHEFFFLSLVGLNLLFVGDLGFVIEGASFLFQFLCDFL